MSALSDLRADLDSIVGDLNCPHVLPRVEISYIVARLRHLLDDRDLSDAPMTSEIIAHLEAGGTVERWSRGGGWYASTLTIESWRLCLATHGDQRQHGYRLGALPPATERVLLHRVMERKIPGAESPVANVGLSSACRWRAYYDHAWHDLAIAEDDGTVEVLR